MDNNSIFQKAYYTPTGYQRNAVLLEMAVKRKKNPATAKITRKDAQQFLDKQAMYQLYKPKPKYIRVPRFNVTKPNDIHQADLLYLPHDMICTKTGKNCKTYKYTLSIIDIASRYKSAVPLETKSASEVAMAFKSVYSNKKNPLVYPRLIMVDEGSEFKGVVTKLMTEHKTIFKRGEPMNHKAQSFVERMNRTVAEKIFAYQTAEEIVTKERSRKWVKELPAIILQLNSQKTALINMAPKQAIKQDFIQTKLSKYRGLPVGSNEEILDIFSLVRYLYAKGEYEKDDRRRATDPIWSIWAYEIDRIIEIKDQPVLYFLKEFEGHTPPKRSFVREELQPIPRDTQVRPS